MTEIHNAAEKLTYDLNPNDWSEVSKGLIEAIAKELKISDVEFHLSNNRFTSARCGAFHVTIFVEGPAVIFIAAPELDRALSETEHQIWESAIFRGKPKRALALIGLSMLAWCEKIPGPDSECLRVLKKIEKITKNSKPVGVMEKFRKLVTVSKIL